MAAKYANGVQPANDLKVGIAKRAVQVFLTFSIQAGVLFLSSGSLDWWEAWGYVGLYGLVIAANSWLLLRLNPATIAERGRGTASTGWKGWDKVVGIVFAVFYFLGILIVAGLDKRLAWAGEVALAVKLGAFAAYALGSVLFSWAMISNAYFSTVVRIQVERGHTVYTGGPYHLVRHPGYAGGCLQSLALPLMLGSMWALIPGGMALALLVIRTALEDQTLQKELPGYAQYTQQTRYRLIPGVW